MGFLPFRDANAFAAFRMHLEQILAEIRGLDNSYVLRTSPTELEQYYLGKARFEPLVLRADAPCIGEQRSIHVNARLDPSPVVFPGDDRHHVPGTQLTIAIHFEGDPQLWKITPSRRSTSVYPEIDLRGSEAVFTHQFADNAADADRLGEEIRRKVEALKTVAEDLRRDVEEHNASAQGQITAALDLKRKQAQAATGAVSALGIPPPAARGAGGLHRPPHPAQAARPPA